FLQVTFDFLIVAFAVFMLIKAINAAKKKEEAAPPPAPPAPSKEETLLTEIRDLLKK
ncbi:MAG: MscL family protein, partial [Bacteroidales bacterium]|nr:MscL family protein [Bacteroidales bacterium]